MNSKILNTKINNFIEEHAGDEPVLLADGLDEAFIGLAQSNGNAVAVYNRDRIIELMINRDGMDYADAVEFYSFNIEAAYVGEHTPLYVTPFNYSDPQLREIERLKQELKRVAKAWKTLRDYGSCCPTVKDDDVVKAEQVLSLTHKKFGNYDPGI